jgi:L-asparaginase II
VPPTPPPPRLDLSTASPDATRFLTGLSRRLPTRVHLVRGGVVESVHRVQVVVTDGEGAVLAATGEAGELGPVYLRSAAKPFQALPLVEDGVADAFGVSDAELAVACGSHGGEEGHRVVVLRLLSRSDGHEGELACGSHPPMHPLSARALALEGASPDRVHNNCSGKHAGMLLLARHHGWAGQGYHEAGHPVQDRMRREVARWTGVEEGALSQGVDGCGVVCFAAPLAALAGAYARLKVAADQGDAGPSRIVKAMVGHPFQVAGTDRLCTALLEGGGGRWIAKVGAEGVYGAAWTPEPGGAAGDGLPPFPPALGIALKVEDGARRAAEVALVETMRVLGALERAPQLEAALQPWIHPPVRNTRGETAARLEPVSGEGVPGKAIPGKAIRGEVGPGEAGPGEVGR